MTRTEIETFVGRWHDTMRAQCVDPQELDELAECECRLLSAVSAQRHLRRLGGHPLLCALICALNPILAKLKIAEPPRVLDAAPAR